MLIAHHFALNVQRLPGNNAPAGEKRIRNVPITIQTALQAALSSADASDQPIIYEVSVKYVEIYGQIESISYDQSSLVCLVDDGTGKIHLKQYFGMKFRLRVKTSRRAANRWRE
jgi:hypothetical protein